MSSESFPAADAAPVHLDVGVAPGDLLAGKYQVERVLGVGGMGVVVAAHHVHLDTKVALKFLLPEMLTNAAIVERFGREARAAVKIKSEHVARVLDVGTLETGAPYIVMEYLEGGDLAAWLEQRGPLPIEQAVDFILQASVAIAEAHGLGIVHRDLKPANMFCVRRPDGQLSIKVLDFGISKMTDTPGGSNPPRLSMTRTSAVMGSPFYMSPEQMQSTKSVDAQTDIWSLGVILYELIAGKVPFYGEAATEIAIKVATEEPPSIRLYRPDVPPALEAAILKCLARQRIDRFANVAEMAVALAEFAPKGSRALLERIRGTIQASGLSVSALALPPTPKEIARTAASAETFAPVGQTDPQAKRAPRVGVALVIAVPLLALVALAALGVSLTKKSHADAPSGTVATTVSLAPDPPTPLSKTPALDSPVVLNLGESADAAPSVTDASAPVATGGGLLAGGSSTAHAPRDAGASASAHPVQTNNSTHSSNCDPPFTLDEQGRKHFKLECYPK